jgi:serine/threonine protein kinase
MDPERWRQIEDLYHWARERGRRVLEDADPDLRREVERLLEQDSNGKILDRPAGELMETGTIAQFGVGTQLGPYRIEKLLGAGGMGEVLRAVDTRLGRAVAIKTCREQFTERFHREARALSALNHPNILRALRCRSELPRHGIGRRGDARAAEAWQAFDRTGR